MQTPFITVDVTPSHPYAVKTVLEISQEEFIEFCKAPYIGDPIPEQFKDCPKFSGNKIILDFDFTHVAVGLTKKEYNSLLKECKNEIEAKKQQIRKDQNEMKNIIYQEVQLETLIEKYKNIQKRLTTVDIKFNNKFNNSKLDAAKTYPINNIVEVKNGFAKCVWHGLERTPSMKFYPKENRVHCFSCNKGGDAVDVCMAVNNITMPEAIKMLNG